MKIICIGRNYTEHARELNNPVPSEPVIFLKPETAILKNKAPFYLPGFSDDVHHEAELVVKINKPGKLIGRKFSFKYFDEITIGIDFTARDLQNKLKEKGLPWEKAKGFDGSAPVGTFIKINEISDPGNIDFKLMLNHSLVQQGNSSQMIFGIDEIISYASRFFTLKPGDLIFTGTPSGVGKVSKGDLLQGFIGERLLLDFEVK